MPPVAFLVRCPAHAAFQLPPIMLLASFSVEASRKEHLCFVQELLNRRSNSLQQVVQAVKDDRMKNVALSDHEAFRTLQIWKKVTACITDSGTNLGNRFQDPSILHGHCSSHLCGGNLNSAVSSSASPLQVSRSLKLLQPFSFRTHLFMSCHLWLSMKPSGKNLCLSCARACAPASVCCARFLQAMNVRCEMVHVCACTVRSGDVQFERAVQLQEVVSIFMESIESQITDSSQFKEFCGPQMINVLLEAACKTVTQKQCSGNSGNFQVQLTGTYSPCSAAVHGNMHACAGLSFPETAGCLYLCARLLLKFVTKCELNQRAVASSDWMQSFLRDVLPGAATVEQQQLFVEIL